MKGAPPRNRTSQEHAVEWLRAAIVARELRPGARVVQEEVAERIGVSVVPVREALRVLEQEGQLTYRPRRGYFVTELAVADLEEIYALRALLEARAVRCALPQLDDEALARMRLAAGDCDAAAAAGDVAAELEANRRFHFAIMEAPGQAHLLRLIRTLWESTEAYRAIYYNDAGERDATLAAHERIVTAVEAGQAEPLIDLLDAHRERALAVLRKVLAEG